MLTGPAAKKTWGSQNAVANLQLAYWAHHQTKTGSQIAVAALAACLLGLPPKNLEVSTKAWSQKIWRYPLKRGAPNFRFTLPLMKSSRKKCRQLEPAKQDESTVIPNKS